MFTHPQHGTCQTRAGSLERGGHVRDQQFEVVVQTRLGQTAYVVVAPTGAPLYSFADAGQAAAEVALLNEPPDVWEQRRGSRQRAELRSRVRVAPW